MLAMFGVAAAAASTPPPLSVFGHKVPDTDAVCAAMVYAWELGERGIPAKAFRLGSLNRETEYVLQSLGLDAPPLLECAVDGVPVAIVDTNNPAELPDGIEKAAVHSIVDHHKLCGLKTSAPLEVDVRALCSTGSILYARAKAAGRTPPPVIAGLMLSCILSDSLHFRSPTTTALDRELAAELAALAGLDVDQHADAMLDAKAEIGHLSPEEVVMMDSKVFEIGGRSLRVSVVETTRPEAALRQRAALVDAQRRLARSQQLDDVLLFVVDVLNEEATFVAASESAAVLVERAWGCRRGAEGTCVLPGVLSRKKQIIPSLEESALVASDSDVDPLAEAGGNVAAPPAHQRHAVPVRAAA